MEVLCELNGNKKAEMPSLVYVGILHCCTVDTNSPLKQITNIHRKMLFALMELLEFSLFQGAVFTHRVLWLLKFISC